jgi:hypothetical protein
MSCLITRYIEGAEVISKVVRQAQFKGVVLGLQVVRCSGFKDLKMGS